jgi:hypothetical protein
VYETVSEIRPDWFHKLFMGIVNIAAIWRKNRAIDPDQVLELIAHWKKVKGELKRRKVLEDREEKTNPLNFELLLYQLGQQVIEAKLPTVGSCCSRGVYCICPQQPLPI